MIFVDYEKYYFIFNSFILFVYIFLDSIEEDVEIYLYSCEKCFFSVVVIRNNVGIRFIIVFVCLCGSV